MKIIGCLLVLLGAWSAEVRAQPSNAYVFVAPGGVTCCGSTAGTLHFGGGGEGVLGKGIGLGAELGVVGARRYFGDSALGVLSVGGYYHFVHGKELRADPFVTAGYTLMFRSGHGNLVHFGGGLNYWFHSRLGARLEMRDHVHSSYGSGIHYWGIRMGLAFR